MAIDRTTKWRCQWQGKNGWANMLEIIPAGDLLIGTDLNVTSFSRSAFEMDFAEFGFDDLPIGMMKSQAASFSFIWANLPSGLKELLKTPRFTPSGYDQETTTLFVYYNDEGTNTLRVQYIGAQANVMGNKFVYKLPDGVYSCQIETFDLLKTILDNNPSNSVFGCSAGGGVISPSYASHATTTEVKRFLETSFGTNAKYDVPPSTKYLYLFYSIAQFRTYFGAFINTAIAYWTRSGLFGYEASVGQTNYPDVSLTLYAPLNNTAYAKGTALDETNTLILGHVCENDGSYTSYGGFFSNDKEGVSEFDSMSTFIAALCENFACKLIYKPITQVNGVSGDTLLTYNLYWLRPLDSVGTPVTLSAKITAESYDISTAEKVFLIAETEIPNMAGDNVNMSRVSNTVSDKNDTWNCKAILHNLPTVSNVRENPEIENGVECGETKIYARKLYYLADGYFRKIHTSVAINDGTNTKTLDTPIAKPASFYPAYWDAWAISMQQTQGLPQAIAEYITTYWSNQGQALREFPAKMVTAEIVPSLVGDLFALPAITDIGVGATSVLLSGKPDWDLGVMDCKFLSLP